VLPITSAVPVLAAELCSAPRRLPSFTSVAKDGGRQGQPGQHLVKPPSPRCSRRPPRGQKALAESRLR